MKKYIINAISDGYKVIINFGKEYSRTFDQLLDSFDGDDNLIELGQSGYSNSYLVNLNQVDFVKIQKPTKQFNSF